MNTMNPGQHDLSVLQKFHSSLSNKYKNLILFVEHLSNANCPNYLFASILFSCPCFCMPKHLKSLSCFPVLFAANTFFCFLNMLELFAIILSISRYLNLLTNTIHFLHVFLQLSCGWETLSSLAATREKYP